jgi:hypothetical protein
MDDFGSDKQSPEKDLLHKEKIKIIHESLMLLTDKSPEDAHLVQEAIVKGFFFEHR